MQTLIDNMYRQVLQSADADRPCEPLGDRPVFLLAPNSNLGRLFVPMLVRCLPRAIAAIDDQSSEDSICGLPRWSAYKLVSLAAAYPDAVALDFSVSGFASAMFHAVCREANIEKRDFVSALAEYDLPAVYETVGEMRSKTLSGIERFLGILPRLADDLSRVTLLSALLLRLTYDRAPLRNSLVAAEDEYFSSSPVGSTFRLRHDEVFCDAGAHVGTMVAKFLAATNWRYRAIHAFEPDSINYKSLRKFCLLPVHDFRIRNRALSDRTETLTFAETGTMGSHISSQGGTQCKSVTLDDELESLTFLKMDVEGFEARALRGATRLIQTCKPRIAVTAYHYANDLLDIVATLEQSYQGYELRLRQHYNYYYDTVLYACPPGNWPA